MHLKSGNGSPINVLVLNQDEGVAAMVPMPKYPRMDRQQTGQQDSEKTSGSDKSLQHQEDSARSGKLDEDPVHVPQHDRTDEMESSMDIDQPLSERPDRSPQKCLAAIVERLHSNNEEKSSQDDLASGETVWAIHPCCKNDPKGLHVFPSYKGESVGVWLIHFRWCCLDPLCG